jgi:triphosphatase
MRSIDPTAEAAREGALIESREIELKLDLTPDCIGAFRATAALGDPKRRPVRQVTTYFDTPEGLLRKAGYTLRLRRRGPSWVQTVKHRGGESGGFSSRAEWERKVAKGALDFAALKTTPVGALLSKREARRLETVSETRVERTIWRVARGGSEIEIILDEGEVASGSRREPVCEVELELKSGERAALFALAREIASAVPLRMGVASKSERGLRLLEGKRRRVRKAEAVRLDPDMTIAEAFAAIVQACLRYYRLNEAILLARRSVSALHQARVAMRRLRSALALFRPIVRDEDYERLRGELRRLTERLGQARNLDVLLAGEAADEGPDVRRALKAARKAAYGEVEAALHDRRLPALILDLVAWAETGEWRTREAAGHPILEFADARLDKAWRRVRKSGADLAGLDPEPRHRLRIEVKKLRYAAEFFAALTPRVRLPAQKAFLACLEAMQESLGKLNDFETARALAPALTAEDKKSGELAALLTEAQRAHATLVEQGRYWG